MRLPGKTDKSFNFLLLSLLLGLFFLGRGGFLFAELDEPPRGTEQAGFENLGEALQGDEDREILEDLRRGVLVSVSWIFLVVGLVLVSLTLRKTYLWMTAVRKASIPPTRYFNLQLQVRGRGGDLSLHSFDYYPIIVAAGGTADLLLPGFSDSQARFRIDYHHGQAHLSSENPVIVNGVPRRQKPLKQGDRIVFGPYRLGFKDASIQEQATAVPGKPVFAWQFPIVALLLALSVLFRQAGAAPENTMLLARAAQLQSPVHQEPAPQEPAAREQRPAEAATSKKDSSVSRATRGENTAAARTDSHFLRSAAEDPSASRQGLAAPEPVPEPAPAVRPALSREPPVDAVVEVPEPQPVGSATPVGQEGSTLSFRRADRQPAMLQASVLGTFAPEAMQNDGINPLEAFSFTKKRSRPDIGRTKVRVIAPGRPVEYFKTDILFIHAHPDDESIDFGSLMARASRSNKRIVTLLFTDGESGLDLYPQRKVGDIYPARVLKGGALSQVRVVEATRALSILGSEMYLRWGLENRPYNTQRDVVPLEEVIRGWGGKEQLVARLIEVLEGFQPTVVVSPDSHSKAYEHFEHEAVGELVQAALERLRRGGSSSVKGYLVSIDPYQVDRYTGVTAVDAQIQDGESGFAYRAIQALALKEHLTQRDASVIGVSRLSHLPQEYYKALFWDLDASFEDYLKESDR